MQVRFSDCDPLGHVNNAVYLTYLEQARIVLWRQQIGLTVGHVRRRLPRGEGFILARAEVDFRAQAHEGDELEVRLSLGGFGRSSATYDYEIVDDPTRPARRRRENGAGVVRLRRNKSVTITDELKTRLATPVVREFVNG